MTAFAVKTSVLENYAAHDDDWDGVATRWKAKPGSTYIVETASMPDVLEVMSLICEEDNALIERVESIDMVEDSNHESKFVKSQKEYDPDGWDTLYLDPVIRRGKNAHWFMKRGYIAGNRLKHEEEYVHLAGKFVGWIDNLSTGKCVVKIEGDTRETL